jgi:hypothetical protein
MILVDTPSSAQTGTSDWSLVVDALRSELAEYGGLLRLFEEQQDRILALDATAVADYVPKLEQQAAAARYYRNTREDAVRGYATAHGCPADRTLRQLLPEFPVDVRPLLEALIDEINHLISRTKKRTHQNQLMLARLVEFHRELVPTLRPQSFTKTYSRHGQVSVSTSAATPTYRATG